MTFLHTALPVGSNYIPISLPHHYRTDLFSQSSAQMGAVSEITVWRRVAVPPPRKNNRWGGRRPRPPAKKRSGHIVFSPTGAQTAHGCAMHVAMGFGTVGSAGGFATLQNVSNWFHPPCLIGFTLPATRARTGRRFRNWQRGHIQACIMPGHVCSRWFFCSGISCLVSHVYCVGWVDARGGRGTWNP